MKKIQIRITVDQNWQRFTLSEYCLVLLCNQTAIVLYLHRVRKKTNQQYFRHNFIKCWPIFKILPVSQYAGNLQ